MNPTLLVLVVLAGALQMLLAATDPDALQAAVDALQHALSAGELNPILAVVAGVCAAGILVLKALGKSIPIVDPLVKAALELAAKLTKKAPPPPEATPGTSNVVELQKIGDKEEK